MCSDIYTCFKNACSLVCDQSYGLRHVQKIQRAFKKTSVRILWKYTRTHKVCLPVSNLNISTNISEVKIIFDNTQVAALLLLA